jgi:protein tyrosine phosphatase (PTP) superfamily phosphohydrolase (DUF442 family)
LRIAILIPAAALLVVAGAIALADAQVAPAFPAIGDAKILPNAHRVTAHILSGAQPEGDAGFKQLADLGVKTLISVDGAAPDVETAKKYGLRYIHLPITYSGVTPDEGKRLAKALQELPGPIYVHCHHGQHRSAAAVAVACVMSGQLEPEQAEEVLKTFGTGENYVGLWHDARAARPLDPQTLAAVHVEYAERAKLPALAEAMVDIDQSLDDLKALQKAGWRRPPTNHPDLDAAHEALLLREKLHEVGRSNASLKRPADYREKLRAAEAAAESLEEALRSDKNATGPALQIDRLDTRLNTLGANCMACHKAYRD